MVDVQQMQGRAMQVAALYDELNLAERGRTWTRADTMMGFVGDVGDLAKLVMTAEGTRDIADHQALGHELADCLWSVLVLAKAHDVDLESESRGCMDILESSIRERL